MNAALASAPASYSALVDAWSWTLFEGDPVAGTLTLSFIDDEGRVLRTQDVSVLCGTDLCVPEFSASAQFFR